MAKHRLFGKSKDVRKLVDIRGNPDDAPEECPRCGAVVLPIDLEEHEEICDSEVSE